MKKSTREITKSPQPRPAATGTPILVRLQAAPLDRVDNWRRHQADLPGRPEAIRRLVELGLGNAQIVKPPSKKSVSKSSAMAGEQIDRLQHGQAITPDEQASRKRRLLKGPKEFRDMRAPKAKAGK
jgi:hypothetical protein